MSLKLLGPIAILLLSACATSGVKDGPKTENRSERRGLLDYSQSPLPRDAWQENSFADNNAQCRAMTRSDRERLLELADPSNFPRTRYRRGPRRPIDKETDCSHFVHEIYRRAGFGFGFRDTRNLKNAPEFELLPESRALPGDLMLFRGHVGIVDIDGNIISATKTRRHSPRGSITRMARDNFRPIRGARSVLRFRCRPAPSRHLAQDPR